MCLVDSVILRKSSSIYVISSHVRHFSCFFYDLSTALSSCFFTILKLKEFHNQVQYRYSNIQEFSGDNVQVTTIITKAYHCHLS
jgi:hypothetical protein